MNVIKENKLFIHVNHPWPFPTSNGKQVIVHLPVPVKVVKKRTVKKTKKKKVVSQPRSWVPALF